MCAVLFDSVLVQIVPSMFTSGPASTSFSSTYTTAELKMNEKDA